MSDPVKCITCGAVSYNDPGKTALHCNGCYKKLQQQYTDLLRRVGELANELDKDVEKYQKQFFAGKTLPGHPLVYTEGLISGILSTWVLLKGLLDCIPEAKGEK